MCIRDRTALGDDAKRLTIRSIDESYAGYDAALTAVYANADAVKAALLAEAQKTIPTIGSNIAYYDLEVETLANGSWTQTNEGADILFPYPAGTSQSTAFAVIHMKDDGTLEALEATPDEFGYGVVVQADSTSPFAIAWRRTTNNGTTGGGGGSDGDEENDFWNQVKVRIDRASEGTTVRADANYYDKMPWTVMQALNNNPEVSLIVTWRGGDPVVIPAGQALSDRAGRVYYPLSYLLEAYEAKAADDTADGSVQTPAIPSVNPGTGGFIVIQAPVTEQAADSFVPTPSTEGIDAELAQLESTPLPAVPAAVEAVQADSDSPAQQHSAAAPFAAAAAAVLAALGLWMLRIRRTDG